MHHWTSYSNPLWNNLKIQKDRWDRAGWHEDVWGDPIRVRVSDEGLERILDLYSLCSEHWRDSHADWHCTQPHPDWTAEKVKFYFVYITLHHKHNMFQRSVILVLLCSYFPDCDLINFGSWFAFAFPLMLLFLFFGWIWIAFLYGGLNTRWFAYYICILQIKTFWTLMLNWYLYHHQLLWLFPYQLTCWLFKFKN